MKWNILLSNNEKKENFIMGNLRQPVFCVMLFPLDFYEE